MWNPNTRVDEDCLYLNIWVPENNYSRPLTQENRLAVMVWIYGGGFYSGTSTLDVYDGKNLAAGNNVIVVSVQYRVGPLGFLYLGSMNMDSPGNMGIWDQIMALSWIHENIECFGGDSKRITIFGESAGAASVGILLITPWAHRFYNNAILESASPYSPWALQNSEVMLERSIKLANKIGCKFDISQKDHLINCMRGLDALTITEHQQAVLLTADRPGFLDVAFSPTFDNYLFPGLNSVHDIDKNTLKNANILIGVNKNEGTYFLAYGLDYFNQYIERTKQYIGLKIDALGFDLKEFEVKTFISFSNFLCLKSILFLLKFKKISSKIL